MRATRSRHRTMPTTENHGCSEFKNYTAPVLLPTAVAIMWLLLLIETTPQSSQQKKCVVVGAETTMLIPVVVPFESNVKEGRMSNGI